ncbi:MAG: class I SAM-dependent methyltransferase [Micropruina sp.]|nr:class I SAM-dependent methyltransferase [Micropruina sp.]
MRVSVGRHLAARGRRTRLFRYAEDVNPAPKSAAHSSPHAISWAFAEAFVPESDASTLARQAAREMGLSSVSQGAASVLTFLAKAINARHVAEIGTGAGVSGLALLGGMAPDGILTSIDAENEHQVAARQIFNAAGVPARRARLIAGGALNVLPKLSDGAYDLVLIDGDPLEYVEYVAQALRLLRHGGLLVLHHALWQGLVPDPTNEDDETLIVREALQAVTEIDDFTPMLLPVGDGLLAAVKG